MIIATVTAIIILLGGGAPAWYSNEIDLLNDRLKDTLESGETREQALGVVKEMQQLAKAQSKVEAQRSKDLSRLLAEPQTSADDLLAVATAFNATTHDFRGDLAERTFELRAVLTREQWAAAFADEQ